jgi:hypothetical protein
MEGLTMSKLKLLSPGLVCAGLAACATPPETAPRRPHADVAAINDCSNLVPLQAKTAAAGLAAEAAWFDANYPDAVRIGETMVDCGGRPADRVVFTQDGKTRAVLFDISGFFGRVESDDLDDLLDG